MAMPLIGGNTIGELSRNSLAGAAQQNQLQEAAANRALAMYQYNNMSAADKARFNELAADRAQRGDIALSPWTRGQTDDQARRNSIIEKGLENQLALGMEQYNRATKGQEIGRDLGMAEIVTRRDIGLAPWKLGATGGQQLDAGLRLGEMNLNDRYRNQVLDRETIFRNEDLKRQDYLARQPYNELTKFQDKSLENEENARAVQLLLAAISGDRETPDDALTTSEINKATLADAVAANAELDRLGGQWFTTRAGAIPRVKAQYEGRALWDESSQSFKPLPIRTKTRSSIERLMPFLEKISPRFKAAGGAVTEPGSASAAILNFRFGPGGAQRVSGATRPITPTGAQRVSVVPGANNLAAPPVEPAPIEEMTPSTPLLPNLFGYQNTNPVAMERYYTPGSPRAQYRPATNQNQLVPQRTTVPGSGRTVFSMVPRYPAAQPQPIPDYYEPSPWDQADEFFNTDTQ